MATLPAEGRWSLRLLSDDDFKDALEFLQRDPLINVYLISRLLEERTLAASQIAVVRYNGVIVLVASLATNIVLAGDPSISRDITDSAIALIADRILTRMLPVRAIISPAHLVESLWNDAALAARSADGRADESARSTRSRQAARLSRPHRGALFDAARSRRSSCRPARPCTSEEVGIDPLERDAAGYRERIRELVEKKRSVIRTVDGVIVAKCEYSAVTPDSGAADGRLDASRNTGAAGCRASCCAKCAGTCSSKGKTVTLFVNDFNRPAIGALRVARASSGSV